MYCSRRRPRAVRRRRGGRRGRRCVPRRRAFSRAATAPARATRVAGRPLHVEHWGDALAQGEVAGTTAAGGEAAWTTVPGFWSTIGERTLKYAAWGDGFDEVRVREHGDGAFTAWYAHRRSLRRRARPRPRRGLRDRPRPDRARSAAAVSALEAVVVVPARDEEQRIGPCLRGARRPARDRARGVRRRRRPRPLHRRHARGRRSPPRSGSTCRVDVVDAPAAGVGAARRHGMDLACARLLAAGNPDGLIASDRRRHGRRAATGSPSSSRSSPRGAEAIGGEIVLERRRRGPPRARRPLARRDARARVRRDAVRGPRPRRRAPLLLRGVDGGDRARVPRGRRPRARRPALEDEAFEARLVRAGVPDHPLGRRPRRDGGAHRRPRGARPGPRPRARRVARAPPLRRSRLPRRRAARAQGRDDDLGGPARPRVRGDGRGASSRPRSLPFADAGLVDQVLVVDGASRDATTARAAACRRRGPRRGRPARRSSAPRWARATRCGARCPSRTATSSSSWTPTPPTPTRRTCSACSGRCSATRASSSSRPRSRGRSGPPRASSRTRAAA